MPLNIESVNDVSEGTVFNVECLSRFSYSSYSKVIIKMMLLLSSPLSTLTKHLMRSDITFSVLCFKRP